MSFHKYLKCIKENFIPAVKIEWLDDEENAIGMLSTDSYKIDAAVNVNKQDGSRRSCTVKIDNCKNQYPIGFNNIWIGKKFKLWMGVYLDDNIPYYLPQGVFYVSDPDEEYNPSSKYITLNGVDKWSYLDDTLFGKLTYTYQTNIGSNLFEAIRELLKLSRYVNGFAETNNKSEMIDPVPPLLSSYYIGKKDNSGNEVLSCPYTVVIERGKTFADILLEYATILCANVYYDVNGRLVFEPMIDTADDITDTNKEIIWDYTIDEKTFLGLTQTYKFSEIHNDFIVLGNIVNGRQFKGRVQNRNPLSDTCIQKIGLRPREPYEDNQYYSDEQCIELAKYYAKAETILQKSGSLASTSLFHMDVNKIVTVSTPNNNMSKELFLVTGFSLSSDGNMSLNIVSVNVLKDFSVVEAEYIE